MKKEISKTANPDLSFYEEKERMDLILSSLNTGLALINPDLTVAWVNEVTRSILPWDDLIGKLCYEAAAMRNEPCEGCGAILAFADGQVHETERQSPVDGSWHYIVSIPIKDESGNVVNVLESVTDITERKNVEIDRDNALKELKALKKRLEEENVYLKSEIREARLFTDIIGSSNVLQYVLTRVQQVAATDTTVLIQGETGVGKELVARAIHDSSPRSEKPFISINCAALPPNLIESELFGHERGAFTDAQRRRKGRFELADGGTLFLDEVSELPQETQAKLLRILQDGKFERVGGSKTLQSDARIIVATNRDLNKEISEGRFRADLFYRLNVFPVTVPPLRKRTQDITLLVEHFVRFFNKKFGRHIEQIAESDMEKLRQYPWPGNIRELRNIIERAMITSDGHMLVLQDMSTFLPMHDNDSQPSGPQDSIQVLPLEEVERQHIQNALKATEWRVSGLKGAARLLEINPSTLRSRMKKLGISKPRN